MKYLLVALALLALNVQAKGIAFFNNQAGGKVVLTDDVCKDPKSSKTYEGLYRIYMYTESGLTSEGCFYFEDEVVRVIWANGEERRYPLRIFELFDKSKQPTSKQVL